MPGDSPRFDLYDDLREFLISAKRKKIHDGQCDVTDTHRFIVSIKSCCKILRDYSSDENTANVP